MERTITEQDVNLKEFDVRFEPVIENPFKVFNDIGQPIGTAVLSFVEGGIKLHFILDSHNPEVFDLEVDPKRVSAQVDALLNEAGFFGCVTLQTK